MDWPQLDMLKTPLYTDSNELDLSGLSTTINVGFGVKKLATLLSTDSSLLKVWLRRPIRQLLMLHARGVTAKMSLSLSIV